MTTAPHGFHMDKGNNIQVVKLKEGTCTCNKWESFGIPCSHVLAISACSRIDSWQFVDKHPIGWMFIVVVVHQNSILFHTKLIGLFLIFRLFILIQLYYVIEEDQGHQELGTKWIGENQVPKFRADFATRGSQLS